MSKRTIAIFGGVYNNHHALRALLEETGRLGVEERYCLGDMGGFGPFPDKVFPLLRDSHVQCVQGNYDHSIGNNLEDCACGYTDPRDNHYAAISYDYTLRNTSEMNKRWLAALSPQIRRRWAGKRVLLAHGSPRQTNEFLWESSSSDRFLSYLLGKHNADILFVTHTGIPWVRELSHQRYVINVGAIGRPANDGTRSVWYSLVHLTHEDLSVELKRLDYPHDVLAQEMRDEALPEEFVETVLTGWWTTCLEIMPARERSRGIH